MTRSGAGAPGGLTTERRGTTGWSVTRGAESWTQARPLPRPPSITRAETPGCSDEAREGEHRDFFSELYNVISYIYIAFVIIMAAKFINEFL